MDKIELQNGLKEFERDNKSSGICYVNTKSGRVEMKFGSSQIMKKMEKVILRNQGYKNINSQFNSLFYKREIPELIHVKTRSESRFIKFMDSHHIILAISEAEEINYAKIKIQLSQILFNKDD
ncbi:hypothetical protein SAMN04488029_3924 [Reichenbachiella faecimaris]|uniref:Uncharacterized protein n=1 Tax=Reichenbachiella faecimaris TaxID=692418 RepID=A0A1W2GQI9_REIFA|nr:hypothetical protein [Reichenbachiella faecimaris]SMD38881.1 hypothetical protein SAMN04488029_3924 [Reichenbachiella faecimaris]